MVGLVRRPRVPIPDRSELPAEFVAYLDRQNAEFENTEPSKPILPAASTPPELIEVAQDLDRLIAHHRADGSSAAELIDDEMRQFIDDVLAEKITEPINEDWRTIQGRRPIQWGSTDRYQKHRKDLNSAKVKFEYLLIGYDHSTPSSVASVRCTALIFRKEVARRLGIELELTDEEWWQL